MKPSQRAALFTATALTTLGLSGTAFAQDAVDLGTLTLSANRGESTELARSGVTVEVVTKDDLEQSGETLLADYLARLPGVSLTSNGGIGGTSSVFIRGLPGKYVGVYVDGIDVTDTSGPQIQYDFGMLTTADVSRIEVLKGSQSALYGSEAIGGVINITTNRATEEGLNQSVAAEFGSYNTAKLSYNLSYLGERGSFASTLSRITTDGYSAADEDDGNTEEDGHEATRLSLSGDYALTDDVTVGGAAFWQKRDSDYDELGPMDGTPDELSESEEYGLRAFARLETGAVSHEVSAQYYDIDRKLSGTYVDTYYSPGSIIPFEYPYEGHRWGLAYEGQTELSAATLTFGADATREYFDNGSDDGEQDTLGLWAQADWHLSDQIELVTVLRHDDHSDYGGKTTGRVSLAYLPNPDLTLRASVGTGFRAPSLYERYDGWSGNEELTPETSVSYELGAEQRFGSGYVAATLFRTEITDLITAPAPAYVYVQSEGTSWTQGLELKAGVEVTDRINLGAAYTWTDSEDAETGAPIAGVPLRGTALTLDSRISDAFRGAFTVRHISGLHDASYAMDDYTVADMNLRYALSDQAELYLRVENLFDEDYQVVTGYGTSDRAAYFGVRARF
ncbi:TonB-dependent receptor plug domain-containing protein [Alloyangia pacifica]|uniref:Vitamin B12 transporter n=1 Tax=Alloyangia pacifica TaxID=311180 RepID=A0A1I6WIR8_9RHOB|nr:TonB-dependent receptor [Alloyangia pacifica]SDI80362.1 vitamin B12 transporter [Alloyangia pacifica]SFT25846.1 vitamin B12 transporter [Alloyangia pacifica]